MKQTLLAIILALSTPNEISATSRVNPLNIVTNSQKLASEMLEDKGTSVSLDSKIEKDFIKKKSTTWETDNNFITVEAIQTHTLSTDTYDTVFTTSNATSVVQFYDFGADELGNFDKIYVRHTYDNDNEMEFDITYSNKHYVVNCTFSHPLKKTKTKQIDTSKNKAIAFLIDYKLARVMKYSEIYYKRNIRAISNNKLPTPDYNDIYKMFENVEISVDKILADDKELSLFGLINIGGKYTKMIQRELKKLQKEEKAYHKSL